jgi:hypothetical protein
LTHNGEERRSLKRHNRVRRKIRDFNAMWGDIVQLALSIVAVIMAVIIIVIALNVRNLSADNERQSREAANSAAAAAKSGRLGCERAKLIAPYTLRDYRARHILPENVAKVYQAAIPQRCP